MIALWASLGIVYGYVAYICYAINRTGSRRLDTIILIFAVFWPILIIIDTIERIIMRYR